MRQLMLFGIGGLFGLFVDAGVVQALVSMAGWDPYLSRLCSFLCAATTTWLFNRRYTFAGGSRYGLFGEWVRYLMAMSLGFAFNFGLYSFLVFHYVLMQHLPALAVGIGSLAGFVVNFTTSRYWIFRSREA